MGSPQATVAEVFRSTFGQYCREHGPLPADHYKVANAIMRCRTAHLGGHRYRCGACRHELTLYNSCRNRHCPNCQAMARARWVQERMDEVLPVPYFHVVFTVPEQLRPFALRNRKGFYRLLFEAVADTLRELANNRARLGGMIGFYGILHTWTQTLQYHPHIHCVAPGGAIGPGRKKWLGVKGDFLFPIAVLQKLFRGKLMAAFRRALENGEIALHGRLKRYRNKARLRSLIARLYRITWNVRIEPPFASPEAVIKYLGNYTHRIAISNRRIVKIANGRVWFRYKDRAEGNHTKTMCLAATEFIRRFLMHVVPGGFMRIRHFGFLCNRLRKELLPLCRKLLGAADKAPVIDRRARHWYEIIEALTGRDPTICPCCGKGRLRVFARIEPLALAAAPPVT